MRNKLSLGLALGLAVLLALPAAAQEEPSAQPTAVPEAVNIDDPAGDANYLNGQGFEDNGDNSTPADAGSVSDVLKVWFTNDAETISAHVQTEVVPPATANAYIFRIQVDPGAGSNCLWFNIFTDGPTNPDGAYGTLRDTCTDDVTIDEGVTVAFSELPDGTGLSSITIPRAAHAAFADNLVLVAPKFEVRNFWNIPGVAGATAPVIDESRVGTDYTIAPPPAPPVKNGCTKGGPKAKKKGCKK